MIDISVLWLVNITATDSPHWSSLGRENATSPDPFSVEEWILDQRLSLQYWAQPLPATSTATTRWSPPSPPLDSANLAINLNNFKVNIKVASRAGSVMTVQSSNVEGLPGDFYPEHSPHRRHLYLWMFRNIKWLNYLTAAGGHRHFTATYGTAYDEEEKVLRSRRFVFSI